MDFSRRTTQLLHEDHRNTIALVEMLEEMIAKAGRTPPDVSIPQVNTTLKNSVAIIGQELQHHFTFEEDELFTRLKEAGDVGIAEHLLSEHQAITPVGEIVSEHAIQALDSGFSESSWVEFRSSAGELIERMLAHIQKEEMALLPMVDDLLDPQTDMDLAEIFANS